MVNLNLVKLHLNPDMSMDLIMDVNWVKVNLEMDLVKVNMDLNWVNLLSPLFSIINF